MIRGRISEGRLFTWHIGTKGIAFDVPSGCVCGAIRNQMEGAAERYDRLASAGLCMPGHTQDALSAYQGCRMPAFRAQCMCRHTRLTTPRAARKLDYVL